MAEQQSPQQTFFTSLRDLIARDDLDAALAQLRELLAHSPKLDEVIHHEGRFAHIHRQIRLGVVSHQEATLTQNQIRVALLELITAMEQQAAEHSVGVTRSHADTTALHTEVTRAISIVQSKNVVKDSPISSGRDTHIGDRHEHTHYHYGDKKIPRHLTAPPFLPELFVGREADMQTIHDRLFSPGGHLLLLVNGEGGVGKTSLAARYYHRYCEQYQSVAWVLSEQSIATAVLGLAAPLGVRFEDTMETAERFQVLLKELSNLPKHCLLVIDNANEMNDLAAYYPQLERCTNFHILFTTRINEYAQAEFYKINPLPVDTALEAFRKHYKAFEAAEEPIFRELYEAVGGNTLVLELFAKNLNHFNTKLKKRYLLADLRRDVDDSLLRLRSSEVVSIRYQAKGSTRTAKPEAVIAAMYDFSELPTEEQSLLSVFAVLPAERIGYDALEGLLTGAEPDAQPFANLDTHLLALAQKGWLDYKEADNSFKISPVIQEVAKAKNAERLLADCRTLVNTLLTGLNNDNRHTDNYQPAAMFARLGAAVVQALTVPDLDLVILCQNIGWYHQDTGNLSGMMQYYQKMLDIQTALCATEPDNADFKNGLAISYEKLGSTHTALGNLTQALTFFEKDIELSKELHDAFPQNVEFKNGLAISYSKLGETHTALGNLTQALTFFENYNQLETALHDVFPQNVAFKNGLAISYAKLGETHTALGNLTQALTFFEIETKLFEALHDAFPQNVDFKNGLAISYSKLGETHTALGNLTQALTFFEERNRLGKELHDAFPQNVAFKNGLAISYSKLGDTHTALGNLTQALTFFEKDIELSKELHDAFPQNVEFKNGLAISYEKLGSTHTALGNLTQALTFFENYNQLEKELHEAYPQNVAFKNGLAISYEKLGSTHTALGNLTQALTFFENYNQLEKELHDAFPQNVDFKNGLAISYLMLGQFYLKNQNEPEKARPYIQQGYDLYVELVRDFPDYQAFKGNYAWAKRQLGY